MDGKTNAFCNNNEINIPLILNTKDDFAYASISLFNVSSNSTSVYSGHGYVTPGAYSNNYWNFEKLLSIKNSDCLMNSPDYSDYPRYLVKVEDMIVMFYTSSSFSTTTKIRRGYRAYTNSNTPKSYLINSVNLEGYVQYNRMYSLNKDGSFSIIKHYRLKNAGGGPIHTNTSGIITDSSKIPHFDVEIYYDDSESKTKFRIESVHQMDGTPIDPQSFVGMYSTSAYNLWVVPGYSSIEILE